MMQVNISLVAIRPDIAQSIQLTENRQEQKKGEHVVGQDTTELQIPKIDIKKQSLWQQHKVKTLSAVALLAIVSIAAVILKLYDHTYWAYGEDGGKCPLPDPNDEFNHYYCYEGEWVGIADLPFPGFCDRAKACSLGEKITGCVDGKYFHHLSKECKKNPKGFACQYTTSYGYPSKDCDLRLE